MSVQNVWNILKTLTLILISLSLFLIFCRSCFELLLSVPENEIPFEAWVQFHHAVQVQCLIFYFFLVR